MIPKIKILDTTRERIIFKAHPGDAGFDVYSDGDYFLWPGQHRKIPLGFAIELPPNWFAMISERSGLAANHGLHTIGNIIDSTYRGEVHAIVVNAMHHEHYKIKRGDRIAQMIIIPCYSSTVLDYVDQLSETVRGDKGFGSTDNKEKV